MIKCRFTTPDNQSIVPPLGIMYLASVLRQRGHEVRLVDTAFPEWTFGDVDRALSEFKPDIVGLSAITIEAGTMHGVAAAVKRWSPVVPIAVGGPHASSYPDVILKDPNVDVLCLGEGERSFPEWVERHMSGKPIEGLAGLAYREGDRVLRMPRAEPVRDLDSIPFPAWDLIDVEAYATRKSMSTAGLRRYMALFTSRGCPYRCTYCHDNFGKTFIGRSPANVVEEMRALIGNWDVTDFEIVDDIFNWDLARAKEIFRRIAALPVPIKIHFPNGLRCDQLDDEFLVLAKQAGLQYLAIAVETVSPRLQRLSKKNLKVERVRRVIDRAVDLGLFTRGFFMLGFPTETRDEMEATIRFAVRSRLHEALFFIVTPFGGTVLGEQVGVGEGEGPAAPSAKNQEAIVASTEGSGRGRNDRFGLLGLGPSMAGTRFQDLDYFRGNYNLSDVPKMEVFRLQRRAYRDFYFNPRRVVRILFAHPRRRQLPRWGWMVLRKVFVRGRGNAMPPGMLEEIPPALLETAA